MLLCGGLHAASRRGGAGAQTAVVGVKLALLAAFCGFAAVQYTRGAFAGLPPAPAAGRARRRAGRWSRRSAGQLVWVSLSYSGFNAAIYLAGEARDPGRAVPRAMLAGTAAVTVLYLCLNAVFVLAPPFAAGGGGPATRRRSRPGFLGGGTAGGRRPRG